MLPDKREFSCSTRFVSVRSITLKAPECGHIGDRIIAYIHHLGRLDGILLKNIEDGFVMTFTLPPLKTEKLAEQLNWLLTNSSTGAVEDRSHERIIPLHSLSTLTMQSGLTLPCHIIDVSVSGVNIQAQTRPDLGSRVSIGKTQGRVSRMLDNGVAIEFDHTIPQDEFNEGIVL